MERYLGKCPTLNSINSCVRVDPVEFGASFHEDSLKNRPAKCICYKVNYTWKLFFTVVLILSFGVGYVLACWFPSSSFRFAHDICDLTECTHLVVITRNGDAWVTSVQLPWITSSTARWLDNECEHGTTILSFEFKLVRYYYNRWDKCFEVAQYQFQLPPSVIHQSLGGGIQSNSILNDRRLLFKPLSILRISLLGILLTELLHPFFVFQIFAIMLWFADEYYPYCFLVIVCTILETASDVKTKWMMRKNVNDAGLIYGYIRRVRLPPNISYRGVQLYERSDLLKLHSEFVPHTEVYPGDLFAIEKGMVLPFDAVILWGGCAVSEMNLTGEESPVIKVALPGINVNSPIDGELTSSDGTGDLPKRSNASSSSFTSTEGSKIPIETVYKIDQDTHCSLYGGSTVLALKAPPSGYLSIGLVLRVGYLSRQGRLIRTLLYSSSTTDGDFEKETYILVKYMFYATLICVILSIVTGIHYGFPTRIVIIRSLDLFTDSIPPALPAVLSVGIFASLSRLKKANISCASPHKINTAGQVNTIVLDKTGTLTNKGIELAGCIPIDNLKFPIDVPPPVGGRKNLAIGIEAGQPIRSFKQPPISTNACSNNQGNNNLLIPVGKHKVILRPHIDIRPRLGETVHSSSFLSQKLVQAQASCHNLSFSSKGNVVGDATEMATFQFTKWNFCDLDDARLINLYDSGGPMPIIITPPSVTSPILTLLLNGISLIQLRTARASYDHANRSWDPLANPLHTRYFPNGYGELGIIRKLPFVSVLQRSGVIVRDVFTRETFLFCKGAPDVLMDLCRLRSIPDGFLKSMQKETRKGCRVVAYAGKPLGRVCGKTIQQMARHDLESKITLLGCMVFSNPTKPESIEVLRLLKPETTIIATGDDTLTSLSVANECQLFSNGGPSSLGPKDVVLCDLHVPNSNIPSRVGQKNYFTWTKIQRIVTEETPLSVASSSRNISKVSSTETIHRALQAEPPTLHTKIGTARDTTSKRELMMGRVIDAHSRKLSCFDLRDFICNRNPREFEFVLTGKAYRKLRLLHEELELSWINGKLSSSLEHHPSDEEIPTKNRQQLIGRFELCKKKQEYLNDEFIVSPSLPSRKSILTEKSSWISDSTFYRKLPFRVMKKVNKKKTIAATRRGDTQGDVKPLFWVYDGDSRATGNKLFTLQLAETNEKLNLNREECNRAEYWASSPPTDTGLLKYQPNCVFPTRVNEGTSTNEETMMLSIACSHDALNKTSYSLIRMSLFEYLLRNVKLYTKMSPEDKVSLVTSLQSLPEKRQVLMCGDGYNDCGALSAADVGISLSGNSSSLIAPFNGMYLTTIIEVIKEGRCSLIIAIRLLRFIVLSAFIQFSSVSLHYSFGLNFTDYQYVYVDFLTTLPLSLIIGISLPTTPKSPPSIKLLSRNFVLSLCRQAMWSFFCMATLIVLLRFDPSWESAFVSPMSGDSSGPEIASYENTLIFYFNNYQYIVLALIVVEFSFREHRIPLMISNRLSTWICLLMLINLGMMCFPRPRIVDIPTASHPSPDLRGFSASGGPLQYLFLSLDAWLYTIVLPRSLQLKLTLVTIAYAIGAVFIDSRDKKKRRIATTTPEEEAAAVNIPPNSSSNRAYHVL